MNRYNDWSLNKPKNFDLNKNLNLFGTWIFFTFWDIYIKMKLKIEVEN